MADLRCTFCASLHVHQNPQAADCQLRRELIESGRRLDWPRLGYKSGLWISQGEQAWRDWMDRANASMVPAAASAARARLPVVVPMPADPTTVVAIPTAVYTPRRTPPPPPPKGRKREWKWPERRHQLAPELAAQLRVLRQNTGLGVRRFARVAGLSKSFVCNLELAQRAPSVEAVEKLIAALPAMPHHLAQDLRMSAVVKTEWIKRQAVPRAKRRNVTVLEAAMGMRPGSTVISERLQSISHRNYKRGYDTH